MKTFTILTLLLMLFSIPPISADDQPVGIVVHKGDNDKSGSNRDRAPMHINIDVWYDSDTNTFTVNYDGEATGDVTITRNGEVVASDTEINTVLTVDGTPGLYVIEISTESWTATGSLEL